MPEAQGLGVKILQADKTDTQKLRMPIPAGLQMLSDVRICDLHTYTYSKSELPTLAWTECSTVLGRVIKARFSDLNFLI